MDSSMERYKKPELSEQQDEASYVRYVNFCVLSHIFMLLLGKCIPI